MSWQLLSAAPHKEEKQSSRPSAVAAADASAVSGPAGFQRQGRPLPSTASTSIASTNALAGRAPLSSSSPARKNIRRVTVASTTADEVTIASDAPYTAQSVPWTEKYAPHCLDDLSLAVQSKKSREVQDWLEHQFPGTFRREYCRLMIVTGVCMGGGQGTTSLLDLLFRLPVPP